MFAAGTGLVAFGRWLARNDVAWLSALITRTLSQELASKASALTAQAARPATETPTVLKVVAALLVFSGVMSIAAAISGISSWQAAGGPPSITHFDSLTLRSGAGVYGLAMLVLAFGIYRRQRWGWMAGLLLIGAAVPFSFLQAFSSHALDRAPAFFRVFFLIAMIAVAVYWGVWWYAQRKHFAASRSDFE
jgi:hypothetical protein